MEGHLVKVVIDTSVYVPFINKGTSHPMLELGQGVPLFYMSAVVIEELYAGASDDASIRLLDNLYKTFESAGRLIVPDAADWQKTGRIVAKLGSKYGFEDIFLARITNDILIALSARKIGAVVVTHNTKDFLRIKEFIDFQIHE